MTKAQKLAVTLNRQNALVSMDGYDTTKEQAAAELLRLDALNAKLLEALKLADLLLGGANMNPQVVQRKVSEAISEAEGVAV